MEIRIHNQTVKETPPPDTLKNMMEIVLKDIALDAASVDVIFVDDVTLKNMHAEYLNDSSYTDVITFNLGDEKIEGEIYVSVDRAQAQAETYNVTYFSEINRLIIHGILHLKGYNDLTEQERSAMKEIENRLVERFN